LKKAGTGMTATQSKRLTAADLEAIGEISDQSEIIEGVVREMPPSGGFHGDIQVDLHLELGPFVRRNGLGRTYTPDTGFVVLDEPYTVQVPDLAFVSNDQLPADVASPVGYLPFAPALAVVIVSPSNREGELLARIGRFLAAGSRLVWLIRPKQQTVTVFSPDEPEYILGIDDTLDGGDVLPGFSLPVKALFRRA
jgi:Uma2 family endonuclease